MAPLTYLSHRIEKDNFFLLKHSIGRTARPPSLRSSELTHWKREKRRKNKDINDCQSSSSSSTAVRAIVEEKVISRSVSVVPSPHRPTARKANKKNIFTMHVFTSLLARTPIQLLPFSSFRSHQQETGFLLLATVSLSFPSFGASNISNVAKRPPVDLSPKAKGNS